MKETYIATDVWQYKRRAEEKAFLYEIVANKSTGRYVN
jgi:hypothetical protein